MVKCVNWVIEFKNDQTNDDFTCHEAGTIEICSFVSLLVYYNLCKIPNSLPLLYIYISTYVPLSNFWFISFCLVYVASKKVRVPLVEIVFFCSYSLQCISIFDNFMSDFILSPPQSCGFTMGDNCLSVELNQLHNLEQEVEYCIPGFLLSVLMITVMFWFMQPTCSFTFPLFIKGRYSIWDARLLHPISIDCHGK